MNNGIVFVERETLEARAFNARREAQAREAAERERDYLKHKHIFGAGEAPKTDGKGREFHRRAALAYEDAARVYTRERVSIGADACGYAYACDIFGV